MENPPFEDVFPIGKVNFYCHVSLLEGSCLVRSVILCWHLTREESGIPSSLNVTMPLFLSQASMAVLQELQDSQLKPTAVCDS